MKQKSIYIDIHTHSKTNPQTEQLVIKSLMFEEEFDLTTAHFFSRGIHPWQLNAIADQDLQKELRQAITHPKIIALGEAGLDRSIQFPFEKQLAIFKMQADLAAEFDLPLIIHSVRAFPEIIQIKKILKKSGCWIIHGFRGNAKSAAQLINQGIYLSIGSALLDPKSNLDETLKCIPIEKLFFETDASAQSIEAIYLKAASILGLTIEHLQLLIFANFATCFKKAF